jgi:hypothetical protein
MIVWVLTYVDPTRGLFNGGLVAAHPIGVDGDTHGGVVGHTRASEDREKSEPKETG